MAEKLFSPSSDSEKLYGKLTGGINWIQGRYFDEFVSPSRFVTSAHAGALAAKAANAEKGGASCELPPPYSDTNHNANLESGPSNQRLDEKGTSEQ